MKDKTILITGGTTGIGLATTQLLQGEPGRFPLSRNSSYLFGSGIVILGDGRVT